MNRKYTRCEERKMFLDPLTIIHCERDKRHEEEDHSGTDRFGNERKWKTDADHRAGPR